MLSHTRRDCAKNQRIASSASKQMTEYSAGTLDTNYQGHSELVKRSIQKKWNLDQFLEEASQREDINQQPRQRYERRFQDIETVVHESEDSPPKSGKWQSCPIHPHCNDPLKANSFSSIRTDRKVSLRSVE